MNSGAENLVDHGNGDAILVTASDGTVTSWNEGAEIIFGYVSAEAIGGLIAEIIVLAERFEFERRILRQTLENGSAAYESICRRKNGSLVYVAMSSKLVLNPRDQSGVVLWHIKDLTKLKVLRYGQLVKAKFRGLLQCAPDGMVMVDPSDHIVLTNSLADKLFGYAQGELSGKRLETLLPERYRAKNRGHCSSYFAQWQVKSVGAGLELHGLRWDGSEFPMEISVSTLETEEGGLVCSAIRDISQRKRVD